MALSHAILALLVDCPQSGYDVTKKFESSVGFFWKATHQQVYKELARLEELNLVSVERIPQEGRPDKKRYTLTEAGKQYLADWISQPAEMMPIKEEMLVRVFVGYLVAPEIVLKELQRHRQLHADRLACYQQIEREEFPQLPNLPIPQRYPYLALRRGIRYEQDCVAWCEEAIALLNEP